MDLAGLIEALERARLTGDRSAVEQAFQDLEKDELAAEPGEVRRFRIRGAAPDSYSTLFEAADEPPPTFPADFPWIPGVQVGVSRQGGGRMVAHWYRVDVDSALAHILEHSRAHGWVEPTDLELPTASGAQVHVLERSRYRRQIIVSMAEEARMVLMMEMPVPGPDSAT